MPFATSSPFTAAHLHRYARTHLLTLRGRSGKVPISEPPETLAAFPHSRLLSVSPYFVIPLAHSFTLSLPHSLTPHSLTLFLPHSLTLSLSHDERRASQFASRCGLTLHARTPHSIVLSGPDGALRHFELLHEMPFSAELKRMGVLLRDVASGRITFYVKGADTVGAHRNPALLPTTCHAGQS
eukprot:6201810-Pleurochrysis_carterae.AAC.2